MSRYLTLDPREEKLPKWAGDIITGLRREIAEQARVITTLNWNNPDSNVMLREGLGERYLPKNSDVRFTFKPSSHYRYIDVRHDHYSNGAKLHVMGSRSIVVAPQAGNVVDIWLED